MGLPARDATSWGAAKPSKKPRVFPESGTERPSCRPPALRFTCRESQILLLLSLPFWCEKSLKSCFFLKKQKSSPEHLCCLKTRFLSDRGSIAGSCRDGATSLPLPGDQPGAGAPPSPPRARRALDFGWRPLSVVVALLQLLNPTPNPKSYTSPH